MKSSNDSLHEIEKYIKSVRTEEKSSSDTKLLFVVNKILWYILSLIEVLLALRFILKMVEANSNAGFTSFIYNITGPLAAPFIRVFPTTPIQGIYFEWTTILGMLVYWLLILGVTRLFAIGKTVTIPPEVIEKIEAQAGQEGQEEKH
jgi:hypothetical protein